MSDNEIVKAFESLYKKLLNVKYDLKITRKEFLALNSVDTLINRQKAEIEKLQVVIFKKEDLMQTLLTEKQAYYDELVSSKAEIERLNAKIKTLYGELERVALMTVETNSKEMVGEQE